jgi:hypothetical protein
LSSNAIDKNVLATLTRQQTAKTLLGQLDMIQILKPVVPRVIEELALLTTCHLEVIVHGELDHNKKRWLYIKGCTRLRQYGRYVLLEYGSVYGDNNQQSSKNNTRRRRPSSFPFPPVAYISRPFGRTRCNLPMEMFDPAVWRCCIAQAGDLTLPPEAWK